MKKIVFVSVYNPSNRNDRSGVPYSIFHALQKYYDVSWVKPEVKNPLYKFLIFIEFCFWKVVGLSVHAPLITQLPIRSFFISMSVRKQLRALSYDGIFTLDYVDIAFIDGKKPIFLRIDAVLSGVLGYYSTGYSWLIKKVGFWFENYAHRHITYIFVASHWVKDCMQKGTEKFPLERTVVIKTGANLFRDEIKLRKRLLTPKSSLRLLFVGYDIKRKGIDVAFETTKVLNETYGIKAKLIVIGGKPENEILASDYVEYLGVFDKNNKEQRDRFVNEFSMADLLIAPAKAECHGIVNCEAAAFGLPIYSHYTGGVSDYVIEGVNGRTLPLGSTGEDFAKRIIQDMESREINKFSIESRKLYETQFNWDAWIVTTKKYIDKSF